MLQKQFRRLGDPQAAASLKIEWMNSDFRSWPTTAWGAHGHIHSRSENHRHVQSPNLRFQEYSMTILGTMKMLEARVGIEPTHKGFADLSLTTWVPRLN